MRSLLAALILAVSLPADAQTPVKLVEISPFAGYLFGGSLAHTVDLAIDPDITLIVANHFTYGLRVGLNLTSRLEPEFQWSRSNTEMDFNAAHLGPHIPLTLDYFLAGANYNFSDGRVRPYVSVSLGAARLDSVIDTPTGFRSATNFAGSVGGGVKIFLTPSIGLRFDARGYASEIPRNDFFFRCNTFSPQYGGVIVPVPCTNSWLLNADLTGGLIVAF